MPYGITFLVCLIVGGALLFIADSRRRKLHTRDPARRRFGAVAILGAVVVAAGCGQAIILSAHDERTQDRERRADVRRALTEAVRAQLAVHREKGRFTAAGLTELATRSSQLRALISGGVTVQARPTADGQRVEVSVVKSRDAHHTARAETLLDADGTRRSIP